MQYRNASTHRILKHFQLNQAASLEAPGRPWSRKVVQSASEFNMGLCRTFYSITNKSQDISIGSKNCIYLVHKKAFLTKLRGFPGRPWSSEVVRSASEFNMGLCRTWHGIRVKACVAWLLRIYTISITLNNFWSVMTALQH